MGLNRIDFKIEAVEDRNTTLETGHYGIKEVVICSITVIGGNLSVDKEVTEAQLREWRLDPNRKYIFDSYQAWVEGREAPINGYPLKEWPAISVGMVAALTRLGIRSVEELAELQDDTLPKVGQPGTRTIRDKAREWLKVSSTQGKVLEQITAMQLQIDNLAEEKRKVEIENEALKLMQADTNKKGK